MFTVTPTAAQEILAAAARSDAAGMALRVAARQVADGSIEYGMGFDDVREDDEPVDFGGLKVLIGSPSAPLLADTVLDYLELTPGEHDFVFLEPSAAPQAPGCGTGARQQAVSPPGGCGSGGCSSCGG